MTALMRFSIILACLLFSLSKALAATDPATLLLYGEFVRTAYDDASSDESKVGPQGDYSITTYLYCTESVKGFLSRFFGTSSARMGFVAVSDSRKDIVISLRGTTSKVEWVNNLMVDQLPFTYLDGSNSNTQVHQGFLGLYTSTDPSQKFGQKSLREQIVDELGKLLGSRNGYSVTLVGHSLGGALVTLCGVDLAHSSLSRGSKFTVYTFASPMVGSESFKQLAEQEVNIVRVIDLRDIVPYLPSLDYVQAGTSMQVDGCRFIEESNILDEVSEYHSLDNYLQTLSQLNKYGRLGGTRELSYSRKDVDDISQFVQTIINSAKASFGDLANLVSALRSYVSNFTRACS